MAEVLEVSVADRRELERLAASTVEPHRRVVQAKALLDLADGASVSSAARRYETWPKTVRRWRAKYEERGVSDVVVHLPPHRHQVRNAHLDEARNSQAAALVAPRSWSPASGPAAASPGWGQSGLDYRFVPYRPIGDRLERGDHWALFR